MVYSTLAGDQYNKVIIPRNEGATTKTTLTGKKKERCVVGVVLSVFLELFILHICGVVCSV